MLDPQGDETLIHKPHHNPKMQIELKTPNNFSETPWPTSNTVVVGPRVSE